MLHVGCTADTPDPSRPTALLTATGGHFSSPPAFTTCCVSLRPAQRGLLHDQIWPPSPLTLQSVGLFAGHMTKRVRWKGRKGGERGFEGEEKQRGGAETDARIEMASGVAQARFKRKGKRELWTQSGADFLKGSLWREISACPFLLIVSSITGLTRRAALGYCVKHCSKPVATARVHRDKFWPVYSSRLLLVWNGSPLSAVHVVPPFVFCQMEFLGYCSSIDETVWFQEETVVVFERNTGTKRPLSLFTMNSKPVLAQKRRVNYLQTVSVGRWRAELWEQVNLPSALTWTSNTQGLVRGLSLL